MVSVVNYICGLTFLDTILRGLEATSGWVHVSASLASTECCFYNDRMFITARVSDGSVVSS